jgi:hypothetical protein
MSRLHRKPVCLRVSEPTYAKLRSRAQSARVAPGTLGANLLDAVLTTTASDVTIAPAQLRDLFELIDYVARLLEVILRSNEKVLGEPRKAAAADAEKLFGPRTTAAPPPLEPRATNPIAAEVPSQPAITKTRAPSLTDRVAGPKR